MNREQVRNAERGTRNRPDRLRALNTPLPVAVQLDERHRPIAVKREGENEKCVESLGETWRVEDEWWRQPISRHYFEVFLDGGGHVVLYEDLITEEWFAQMPA